MHVLIWFLFFLYGAMLLFIFLYSSVQFYLALKHYFKKSNDQVPELTSFPKVTVQLPIYNEKYVVERLIRAVAKLDYPTDQLEIQVLDDSTDETIDLINDIVQQFRNEGNNIVVVRRENRTGFKAGALAHGLTRCEGKFVAIFDADFIPKSDFLLKTLPYFQDKNIGLVQTRWEHINKNYNWLTQLQAFGLDAHFSVEQDGRNSQGHFINFNGTAGVWRKETIEDAGGWQSDTLTEDLDLSYRAQLKGWKFKYLKDQGTPAELPAAMNALKTQQYRWTKGGAECAVKNLPPVLRQKELPWSTKVHASFHLLNTLVFVCILLTGVLSLPMLLIKGNFEQYDFIFEVASIFTISLFFLAFFYWVSSRDQAGSKPLSFIQYLIRFPFFMSVYMGLSLHNAIAVLEGYLGRKTSFVRTPKFNLVEEGDSWKGNKYLRKNVNPLTYWEILLSGYFIVSIAIGFQYNDLGLLPFHLMLGGGFLMVAVFSFRHRSGRV
ncbi:MAG: histidine kinase [Crocinitomicaceae bacterium]|nr:histidine kinase [Crocinitomicaceae bacterium]|tara:strand:+ start:4375 stop:5847 length:1473 start_codon:yes stop_codon:yes gene_type:complete